VEVEVGGSTVWRLSPASPPERVFELLDTDEGRVRFWAERSRTVPGGFELEFSGGLTGQVEVVEREPPARMAIRYFGADAELELTPREDGGCLSRSRVTARSRMPGSSSTPAG